MPRPRTKRAAAPLSHAPVSGRAPLLHDTGDGTFAGYASLFGIADDQGDVVAPGAYLQALARRTPAKIAMLYQHDPKCPIGTWARIAEDAHGLWVEGRLALENETARNAYALLRAGALTGLSIGFHAVRATRLPGGGRRLTEIDLWEVSLVTFPMLDAARVTQVKTLRSRTDGPFGPAQSHALARAIRRAAKTLSTPDAF